MQLANVLLDRHAEYMAPMAVALISINDYDQLALVQGQFSARQAAKALGELLQLRFRAEDLRGRWSDRGYVLVAERCDRELLEKALRILQEDFELIQFGGGAFRFTSSFSSGVSDSYDDGPALEGLIKASHLRMKEAMATQKV